jgi:ABC-type glycerol-3-phosphate transport system permease component
MIPIQLNRYEQTTIMRNIKVKLNLKQVATYLILTVVLLVTLYPVFWMIFGSLKSNQEFYTNIWGPPNTPMWENYIWAWERADLGAKFLNSVLVTTGTLALVLPLASFAAYAFAKLQFPGSRILFFIFLTSMMVPQGVTAIPVFTVIIKFGLLNTRLSMILVFAAQSIGFAVFLLTAFFISLPQELTEAALIDGCTPFSAFLRVILPLAKPGLATLVVFTGMGVWNEYFMSSILVRSKELETLPLGLVNFVGQYTTYYPQMFATLTMITVPVILLYILGQKQFISGLTAGAIKG